MFVRNVYCADLDFFLKEILLFMWVLSVPSKDFLLEKRSLKFAACYLAANQLFHECPRPKMGLLQNWQPRYFAAKHQQDMFAMSCDYVAAVGFALHTLALDG